jgi:hypothetical protein
MDKLKEYLLRHKTDLDVDPPPGDAWENIGSKLGDDPGQTGFAGKPWFSTRVVRYAAAACVIALAGIGLWLVFRDKKTPADLVKQNSRVIITAPVPGVAPTPGKEKIEDSSRKKERVAGKDVARHKSRPRKPVEIADEVAVIGKSYSRLIDYQLRKLRTTPLYAENGSYFSFYVEQFKQMDKDEEEVRNDIKTYGLTNEYLDQLIRVYQEKLNLLKNLQTEINKMNNKVREKEAPTGRIEVHYLNI